MFKRTVFIVFVAVGLLALVCGAAFYALMNHPHVEDSGNLTSITREAIEHTLSNSLPPSATNFRYANSSVGMGGRLLVYRFSGINRELNYHAQAELVSHWNKLTAKQTPNAPWPLEGATAARIQSRFGLEGSWWQPPTGTSGTLYESADGNSSQRPTIFIDDKNAVLYFLMTD